MSPTRGGPLVHGRKLYLTAHVRLCIEEMSLNYQVNTHDAGTGGEVAQLLKAAVSGDGRAWEAIVARFSGLVWAIARAHRLAPPDALDVSQVVWLRLLENLDRINEPERLGAWLASVARRECLLILSKASREQMVTAFDAATPVDDSEVAQHLLVDERNAELWRAVAMLPEKCGCLLRILMSDPRPNYEEVAAALDMPIGSIGPTRQRCLERLRRCSASMHLTEGADLPDGPNPTGGIA